MKFNMRIHLVIILFHGNLCINNVIAVLYVTSSKVNKNFS